MLHYNNLAWLLPASCNECFVSFLRLLPFLFLWFGLVSFFRSPPMPRHFLHVFAVFNYLWFVDAFALKLPKYCQAKRLQLPFSASAWARADNQIAMENMATAKAAVDPAYESICRSSLLQP